jgi:MFS family permease
MRARVALFWLASACSSGSTWVVQVSLFVAVLQHSSATALSVVELAGTVPALLCLPFAGTVSDRVDPRVPAFASMVAQTMCVTVMAASLRTSLVLVTVAYAVQGMANSVWSPARQQWLYAVIPPDRRQRANAAMGSVTGVMTIAGAALGGVLTAWSPVAALVVAAGLQALSLVPLAVLSPISLAPAPPAYRPFRADLADGFVAVRTLPLARSVVWLGMAWGFIGGGYNILVAAYAVQVLHGGGHLLGFLYIVDGAGVLLGAAIAARIAVGRHIPLYAVAYVVQGVAWTTMFLVPEAVAGAAFLAVMRVASGVIIALDTTILLATVPAPLRGRITSLHMSTYSAVARLALAVYGTLLAVAGVNGVGIVTGCASTLLGVVWWAAQRRRDTRLRYVAAVTTPTATR